MKQKALIKLGYGRLSQTRKRMTAAVLLVIALTIGFTGYQQRGRWLPAVRERWANYQLYRAEQKLLDFQAPAGQVAYTDDRSFQGDPSLHFSPGNSRVWMPRDFSIFLNRLEPDNLVTRRSAELLWSIRDDPTDVAVCFAGQRRDSNGQPRLVVLLQRDRTLYPIYFTLAGANTRPQAIIGSAIEFTKACDADPLTIFTGFPDTTNESDFTVPYRIGNRNGVIRGSAQAHGVQIKVDSGWDRRVQTSGFNSPWQNEDIWQWEIDGADNRIHTSLKPEFVLPFATIPTRGWNGRPESLLIAFSNDGTTLTSLEGGKGGHVVIWDYKAKKLRIVTELYPEELNLPLSPDESVLSAQGRGRRNLF